VNGLGQRVQKSAGGVTTIFVYDEAGHLLGEYDGTGALIEETVWMEDLPVATFRPSGGGVAIYYVHPDHLGTSRAITRPSDNVFMWRWDNTEAFGNSQPNENPAGQGTFKYGLRFPGQYYDAEIGTNYNYFRDYDPATGRYLRSDPIGLVGELNTYGYVGGNPSGASDFLGLFEIVYKPGTGPKNFGESIAFNMRFKPYRDALQLYANDFQRRINRDCVKNRGVLNDICERIQITQLNEPSHSDSRTRRSCPCAGEAFEK
jgi:RHS repeat-associated protein